MMVSQTELLGIEGSLWTLVGLFLCGFVLLRVVLIETGAPCVQAGLDVVNLLPHHPSTGIQSLCHRVSYVVVLTVIYLPLHPR